VRELRARVGIRQADLAREVGVTRQTIIAIEKGKLNPSILICLKIARILREPVDYVFYLPPGWEPQPMEPAPDQPIRVRPEKEAPKRVARPRKAAATARREPVSPLDAERDAEAGAEEVGPEEAPAAVVEIAPTPSHGGEAGPSAHEDPKSGQAIWDFLS
jgi:putative transcriptional regulator